MDERMKNKVAYLNITKMKFKISRIKTHILQYDVNYNFTCFFDLSCLKKAVEDSNVFA